MNWQKVLEVLRLTADNEEQGMKEASKMYVGIGRPPSFNNTLMQIGMIRILAGALEAGLEEVVTVVSQSPVGDTFMCANHSPGLSTGHEQGEKSTCLNCAFKEGSVPFHCPLAHGKPCSFFEAINPKVSALPGDLGSDLHA